MATTKKHEVRVAAKATAKPMPTKRVAPPKPVIKEKRVTAPNPTASLPTKPANPTVKQKPAEKRVAAKAAAKPVAKKAAPAPKGVPASVRGRLFDYVMLLDETGPDATELIEEIIRPQFKSLDGANVTLRLAFLNKGISRKISGTGDKNLDGERFALGAGELVMINEHTSGGVTVYNTVTAEPVEMVCDAKMAKTLDYTLVPTDPVLFDEFIVEMGHKLAAMGMPVSVAAD